MNRGTILRLPHANPSIIIYSTSDKIRGVYFYSRGNTNLAWRITSLDEYDFSAYDHNGMKTS